MLLLFAIAALVFGLIALKSLLGKPETKEDQELKSRIGASLGSALPPVFGSQTSASLPTPDTSDRMDAEDSHVVHVEARPPDPFGDLGDVSAPRPAVEPTAPAKKKRPKRSTQT